MRIEDRRTRVMEMARRLQVQVFSLADVWDEDDGPKVWDLIVDEEWYLQGKFGLRWIGPDKREYCLLYPIDKDGKVIRLGDVVKVVDRKVIRDSIRIERKP